MKIFDAHCDVLYKMWLDPSVSFFNSTQLHITYEQLKNTWSKVQCFAIYIPEKVHEESRFDVALEMVDIFYTKIIANHPNMRVVRTREEIDALGENEIGAFLTLEGCDCIGGSLTKLKTLYRLGVSSVGLTWNYANEVADGILEERGAGLSSFGKQVVLENNRSFVWTDVSHLSVKGFWDVLDIADYPIASHSNAHSICSHPRNLNDEQIKGLIKKNGMIGITFVPQFLSNGDQATVNDVLNHIEYICALGGEFNLGFGSDFDGITKMVNGLESYAKYDSFLNTLLKTYSETQVNRFLYQNFVEHLPM